MNFSRSGRPFPAFFLICLVITCLTYLWVFVDQLQAGVKGTGAQLGNFDGLVGESYDAQTLQVLKRVLFVVVHQLGLYTTSMNSILCNYSSNDNPWESWKQSTEVVEPKVKIGELELSADEKSRGSRFCRLWMYLRTQSLLFLP